ncbi:patatin-like phospholipase family protein [Bacillus pumilus]|uniref:patatin-like phospholipase family protein n=1 Tax=Bacillus pumilus TaxID=1408 RepID=UPI00145C367C|nr:patatin-like phospholipase family protein [Bacillus pumilus]
MKRPVIGLALGSGGARGMAHIGVLSSLEKQGIQVDMIAGSSIGALVGSFYAAGQDVEKMKKLALVFRRKYYADYTLPKIGLLKGHRILQLIHTFTYGKKFEELRMPLAVVACDLETGEKVVFKKGSVSQAVRASISIPGVFVPHEMGGRQLVDGAVVDRIPVSVLKDMGADLIIASDVSRVKKTEKATRLSDVIMQSLDILQNELVRHQTIHTDVMIRPRLETFSSSAFTQVQEMIEAGELAADQLTGKLKDVIDKWEC